MNRVVRPTIYLLTFLFTGALIKFSSQKSNKQEQEDKNKQKLLKGKFMSKTLMLAYDFG